ncbi:MAG: pyridoxal-phosphate dependent enzyme [Acidobacteriota bacterium]
MSAPLLVCALCRQQEEAATSRWRCRCGGPFEVVFRRRPEKDQDHEKFQGLWRYRSALPVQHRENIVTLGEGMTPLVPGRLLGHEVLLKTEFTNPTGSYKDRGWTVAVSHLKEIGIRDVVEDSSGNAGASLAAYGARAGIHVRIFVPADAPAQKKAQILAHGAQLESVAGGREAVAAACRRAAAQSFYAGHAWNPWFLEGTRTLAWELAEQTAPTPPAAVVMPVGQGGILLGLHRGFTDLMEADQMAARPALVAVQAAACAPLVQGVAAGSSEPPPLTPRPSVADGIRTPRPVRYRQLLALLEKNKDQALAVTEEEILAARRILAAQGFYVEPTSAVAAAGAGKWLAERKDPPAGPVVIILTGHGLKAGTLPQEAAPPPP